MKKSILFNLKMFRRFSSLRLSPKNMDFIIDFDKRKAKLISSIYYGYQYDCYDYKKIQDPKIVEELTIKKQLIDRITYTKNTSDLVELYKPDLPLWSLERFLLVGEVDKDFKDLLSYFDSKSNRIEFKEHANETITVKRLKKHLEIKELISTSKTAEEIVNEIHTNFIRSKDIMFMMYCHLLDYNFKLVSETLKIDYSRSHLELCKALNEIPDPWKPNLWRVRYYVPELTNFFVKERVEEWPYFLLKDQPLPLPCDEKFIEEYAIYLRIHHFHYLTNDDERISHYRHLISEFGTIHPSLSQLKKEAIENIKCSLNEARYKEKVEGIKSFMNNPYYKQRKAFYIWRQKM